MRRFVTMLTLTVLAAAAAAREYAPRVVSPHRADAYSMRTFARYPRWRELRGDALAWEVYRYLVDTQSGVFHVNEVREGDDVLGEYTIVRDPVKTINVYGYAYCAALGPVMAGIWEDMGQGPARTVTLPDWSHVVTEVFYDGSWHYIDLDVRAVFRRDDGTLASLAEARQDPTLWRNSGPLFFPNDDLERTRQIYQRTAVQNYHGFNQGGHTMDYVLRQGETFTRWWTPQGGRWHHPPPWSGTDWLRRLIEEKPRGPKPNHRHFTVHNHANGCFVYRPNLTEASSDFEDGVYDARNVRAAPGGVTLAEPGDGYAVFEVRSPYIIVPIVGDLDTVEDDREASVVRIDGVGASAAVSLDNGKTWQDVLADSWPAVLDLTPRVSGAYGYLLRIALKGRPGEAVVRSLSITTWVQVAPAALPALAAGRNRMEYRTGDHYGLKTRVLEIHPSAARTEEFLRHLTASPADYDPGRKTDRIRGSAVVKVAAPPGTAIAWFTAEGSFRTHQREAAAQTRNTIAFAVEKPEGFREIYHAEVPTDTQHWHCNAHREVRLDRPAPVVYLRYVGDPALNNVRVYAHCLDGGRASKTPVQITHAWREGGAEKVHRVAMDVPGPYEILTGAEPQDQSITIAVPSDGP